MDTIGSAINTMLAVYTGNAVNALTQLLEPVLMVFLGTTIGALVIAMYLPIFNMAGSVGGGG